MLRRFAIGLVLASGLSAPPRVMAQDVEEPHAADHEQLRAMLVTLRDAVNAKNFDALEPYMYSTFSATMIDQNVLTTGGDLTAYFERLFAGDDALITNLTMSPVADELTQIYDDKYGIARGGNTEIYELASGNTYTIESRWTATLIKDEDRWKILAIHSGVNFLDNPLLDATRRASWSFGGGGLAIGLLAGALLGWFVRRTRR